MAHEKRQAKTDERVGRGELLPCRCDAAESVDDLLIRHLQLELVAAFL